MSDFMNRTSAHGDGPGLGIGYATGSAILLSLLVGVLIVWRMVEKSLSVTDVRSRRAEVFYWSAILVSNTLGTSLGDYLADDSGLGFAGGAAHHRRRHRADRRGLSRRQTHEGGKPGPVRGPLLGGLRAHPSLRRDDGRCPHQGRG